MSKIFCTALAAAVTVLAGPAIAATPKAAEEPSATVISVGTPAPRGHHVSDAKPQGKKAKSAKAGKKGNGKAAPKGHRAGKAKKHGRASRH